MVSAMQMRQYTTLTVLLAAVHVHTTDKPYTAFGGTCSSSLFIIRTYIDNNRLSLQSTRYFQTVTNSQKHCGDEST
jgi:hypothetical protein